MSKFKRLLLLLPALFLVLFVGHVYAAAGDVSVGIQAPQSPTRHNDFEINFVALDVQGRPLTAKCFKKGPSDGGFSQFGSDIALGGGGNTDNCPVTGALMSQQGTYQFFVTATAGADTGTSKIVSVDYNTSGPGTPTDYQKTLVNSCQYRIHFKSANDSGKTVKVEVYRSENTSFNADGNSRVATVVTGSNTEHNVFNDKGDCGKDYYYVVRAFDSAGNGSGLIGDSQVTVTTTTTTGTTEETTTAPPVVLAAEGDLSGELGEGAGEEQGEAVGAAGAGESTGEEDEGEVLGEITERFPLWQIVGGSLLVILLAMYVFRRFWRPGA
jgi:hypothetical protein